MKKLEYTVSFTTPAFLGNADQQAQWRTPPFKALIRQWWRVTQKAHSEKDHLAIRQREGLLFGNAWLDDESRKALHRKSILNLRIEPDWSTGGMTTAKWPKDFGTVETTRDGRTRLPADLFTGFGPVISKKSANGQRHIEVSRGAIDTTQKADLRLWSTTDIPALGDTMQLIHWFGTLGSRSRNGWGSLTMAPKNEKTPLMPHLLDSSEAIFRYSLNWKECLSLDWPHAIGSDQGRLLVWVSEELDNWRKAVGRLARVGVAVRLAAKSMKASQGSAGAIHFLGYPAGTGRNNPWELPLKFRDTQEPRLASPLRFKVIRTKDGKKVHCVVYHLPCGVPEDFLSTLRIEEARWLANPENQEKAWASIHRVLDRSPELGLKRLGN